MVGSFLDVVDFGGRRIRCGVFERGHVGRVGGTHVDCRVGIVGFVERRMVTVQ